MHKRQSSIRNTTRLLATISLLLALLFPTPSNAFQLLWWQKNTPATNQNQTRPSNNQSRKRPSDAIKWHVMYTQTNPVTGKTIHKATSGFGDPRELMRQDEKNHPYPRELGYGPPEMVRYTSNSNAFRAYAKQLDHSHRVARTYAPYPYKTEFGYNPPPKDEPPEEEPPARHPVTYKPPLRSNYPPPVSRTDSHVRMGIWDYGD